MGCHFPLRQLLGRLGHPLGRLVTFGATGGLLLRRPCLPIGRGVPLQEEGRNILAQRTRQSLPLDERDQLILIALSEHPLKRGTGPPKKFLAQCFPILAAQI